MKKGILFCLFLLILTGCLLLYLRVEDRKSTSHQEVATQEEQIGKFEIAFLDIGQGDATFITFPNGTQMLLDCAIDARILEALGRVMPFYDTEIDYLVVSHPDLDHYGGCIDVLERFKINTIILNGLTKEDDFWHSFSSAVQNEDAVIKTIDKGEAWDMAGVTLHWLYPDHSIQSDPRVPGFD